MAANFQQSYIIRANIHQLSNVLRSSLFSSQLQLSWVSEDINSSGVWFWFHHGMSFASYGEKIFITLTPVNSASTNVHIRSECSVPTQIFDMGKNKQMVNSIYAFLLSASEHFTPPQPGQAAAAYCTRCGKAINQNAKFCTGCGAKLG